MADIKTKSLKEIEEIIVKAIKKIGGKKENELCKYIPVTTGGYMHHFTLKKMKNKQPQQLCVLIDKFINNSERPRIVPPKQRAPRGSRKRKDHFTFTRGQLERMLNIARLAGDREMISLLSPKKSLAASKRELINSVKHGRVEPELWNSYVESVNAQQSTSAYANLLSPSAK